MREEIDDNKIATGKLEVNAIGRREPKEGSWLIRDVSFTVQPGERVAVVGPTGAGKSVLLRALALLDPLHAGSIHWHGHEIRDVDVPLYRRQVLYVHQRPAFLEGTVEENLQAPYGFKANRGKRYECERVVRLLDGLGQPRTFLERSTRDLSGGESQIVAVLRAVQLDPAILLLDEPTASLDPNATRAVESLVDHWFREQPGRRAFLWVSHDVDQPRRIASRRLHMRSGRLDAED